MRKVDRRVALRRQEDRNRAARTARELALTEARFRDFLETSADWLWETDLEQRFTYYSRGGLPEFGESPVGRLRGELLREMGAEPTDLAEVIAGYMAREEPFRDLEYSMRRADGETVWVRLSGKPVRDRKGRVTGYRGSTRKISEARVAEKTLQGRQARYESIFANAVEGMYRTMLDGTYLEVNPAMARMHGCAGVEEFLRVFPTSTPVYADPDDRARLAETAMTQGYIRGFECQARRRDGSRFLMSETCWPVRDAQGRIIGFEGLVEDITERKRAEQALEQARNEALEASRAKSDFLAHVSHELRTPLNAVIGYSDAMLQQLFGPLGSPRYSEYCRHIHDSGRHLLALINDLLDLSKVEAGQLELHPERLDLAAVARAALDLVEGLAETQRVPVSLEVRAPLAPFRGDERAVKQILVNLLSNAVKFTPPPGRVQLTLSADVAGARLLVEDGGIGMTAEEIEIALLPFRQVDTPLSRRIEGTGLGLPLVKALTEAHGGSLSIESRPGQGTRIEVLLANLESAAQV